MSELKDTPLKEEEVLLHLVGVIEAVRTRQRDLYHDRPHPDGKRFTQGELTDLVCPTYKNYLLGRSKRLPSREMVIDIAQYLECSLEETNHLLQAAQYLPLSPREKSRRQVTIMVTRLNWLNTEARDYEDFISFSTELWQDFGEKIKTAGGKIETQLGDTVIASWGTDIAQDDDAERAVRVGLEISQSSEELGAQVGLALDVRIGIDTGFVLMGVTDAAGNPTIRGEPVQNATMLAQSMPVNAITITEQTFKLVRGVFDVAAYEPERPNLHAPARNYYLVERAKTFTFHDWPSSIEGVHTTMVGRDAELNRLKEAMQTVLNEKQPKLVTLMAPAGHGKTRLVFEFTQWIDLLPEYVMLFRAKAMPGQRDLAYALFKDMLTFRFSLGEQQTLEQTRARFESEIVSPLDSPSALTTQDALAIARLFGFDVGDADEESEDRRTQAVAAFVQYIAHVCTLLPVVIVVEDLHWVDSESLQLLTSIGERIDNHALFLLATARPSLRDHYPSWGRDLPNHQEIPLQPLEEAQSLALVEDIFQKAHDVPIGLKYLLVKRTNGVPFFIEEFVKMLIDEQVIFATPGRWYVNERTLSGLRIPSTLVSVLQMRVDRLAPIERAVLRCAAVLGETFWDDALSHLYALNDPEHKQLLKLDDVLSTLILHEIVFRNRESSIPEIQEYVFSHSLLRDVVYQSLPREDRLRLHLGAATWLHDQAEQHGRTREYAAAIARQFEQAEQLDQAIDWYVRSSEEALLRYAHEEALRHLNRALGLLSPNQSELQLSLMHKVLDIQMQHNSYHNAKTTAEIVMKLAEDLNDPMGARAAELKLGYVERQLGNITTAEAHLLSSQGYFEQVGDKEWLGRAIMEHG
ncbi:MAG: AAA family ATPase, partial [Chloroflexi bacterium]|nr:AAA family ATPase [Chloroflexota bacterium]